MNKEFKDLKDFLPHSNKFSDVNNFVAISGKKNLKQSIKIDISNIIEAIKLVHDPEIPINVYDLGLIYDIKLLKFNDINIKMSLTSPGCPVAGLLPEQVADSVASLNGAGQVKVELVWDPPWSKDKMSPDAKLALEVD